MEARRRRGRPCPPFEAARETYRREFAAMVEDGVVPPPGPRPSREEVDAAVARHRAGDRVAGDALATMFGRLVAGCGRRFAGRGVELADLYQEGMLALLRAADDYDAARGYRFSTLVVWRVERAMQRAVKRGVGGVRIPEKKYDELATLERSRRERADEVGGPCSFAEAGARLGWSSGTTRDVATTSPFIRLQSGALSPVVEDDEGRGDVAARLAVVLPEEVDDAIDAATPGREAMRALDPRSRLAVMLRFGLWPYEGARSLVEVGDCMGISGERVRQLEVEARRRMGAALSRSCGYRGSGARVVVMLSRVGAYPPLRGDHAPVVAAPLHPPPSPSPHPQMRGKQQYSATASPRIVVI